MVLIASVPLWAFATPSKELVSQGERLFQKRNFDEAFEKFNAAARDSYLESADLAHARCRLGIIYSIRDVQKQARMHLEWSLASNSLSATLLPLCHYALVQIYVIDKSFQDAKALLQRYPDTDFPPSYKSRVLALGVAVARQLKDTEFEVTQLSKLAQQMEQADLKRVELKILGDWSITLEQIKSRLGESPEVRARPNALSHRTPVTQSNMSLDSDSVAAMPTGHLSERDILSPLRELRRGDLDKAIIESRNLSIQNTAQKAIISYLQIDKIRERAENLMKDPPRVMRLGVILPQGGGMFARLQLRALKGLSAFLNSRAAKDVDYQIHLRTVANDSGASERAALELILSEKVHAIVGPFYGSQVLGVATAASFYGVPVMTWGPVTSAHEFDSRFTVRIGTLARSQAFAHVDVLKREKQNSVSVLAPTDGYGVEMTRAFESVCKAEGIQIRQVEFVDDQTELFQEPVKALLGPQDGKNRSADYWKLVSDAKKKAAQEKRKFDPSSIKAPAHVPFAALFVPDALDRVRLIANTFAFFEARSVRFLGDRTWQEAGGRTSIADQFLNGARVSVPKAGSFLPFLQRELSAGESVLDIERQAFDTALIVRMAHYKSGGNNPARLIAAMRTNSFSAEGAGIYGPVDAAGEPLTHFETAPFQNGKVLNPGTVLENSTPENVANDAAAERTKN
jgi:hypothetical protein